MLKFKSFKMVLSVGILIDIMLILIMVLLPYMTKNNYVIAVASGLLMITVQNVFNLIDDMGHFCMRNLPINIIGFILIVAFYLFVLNAKAFTIPIGICTALIFCLIILLSLKPLWVVRSDDSHTINSSKNINRNFNGNNISNSSVNIDNRKGKK
ncbi:hypothetical protein SAC12B_0064 [Lactobacillus phage SAC12B]|uniref:Uncharacterized protein n=1 Tax=Lactobacillus phage SAC12B TaxID=2510941 RepID=A0A4Y5FFF0_9CAUD|nr:hypothetical protein HWC10_gp064 [Lactobacillus phage SAC12B]QBJ03853.1 hypothetical protein SAC12B_0064 [Lactobacillus phage SAC12B]